MSQKTIWIIVTVVAVLLLLTTSYWLPLFSGPESNTDIISRGGIHWHPYMEIYVHGEKQEIPTDIGLIGDHNPMHTHDSTGEIHLEYEGLVRERDITVGSFFELWGREFSCTQLFDNANGPNGEVVMTVNGKVNTECGDYVMRDKDEIVIRYEEISEVES